MNETVQNIASLDDQLSKRPLELDSGGYFIIYLDIEANLICAKHYTNTINEQGLATDPETGQVIPAKGKVERTPTEVFKGRSAKELSVKLFEKTNPCPVTQLSHAAYLGREFVRAEIALINQQDYIQD